MTTTDELVMDVSQDWVLACDVQQRFMQVPGPAGDSMDYSARCRQVKALGGDCYDFMPLTGNRVGLIVGDASGKGLAAALVMANVQSSLRTAALLMETDLAVLLKVVNQQVYTSSLTDRFATLFYGVFDGATRTLRYVNAGHNPPVIIRQNGEIIFLESSGAPVGMFPDSTYEESMVRLEPGDRVIAYTDGVIEAANPEGEEWGVSGLLKAATTCVAERAEDANDLVELIFNSMDDFAKDCQRDDATLAVVRVL